MIMPDIDPTAEQVPVEGSGIAAVYFNGFQLGLSNADVGLLVMLDNQPILKLHLSYTIAKTLMKKMQEVVETLEKSTGREIMTTDDAGRGLGGNKK